MQSALEIVLCWLSKTKKKTLSLGNFNCFTTIAVLSMGKDVLVKTCIKTLENLHPFQKVKYNCHRKWAFNKDNENYFMTQPLCKLFGRKQLDN